MKKKLLWIIPVALLVLLLVGLGFWLDHSGGQPELPEVTVPGTEPSASSTPEKTTEPSTEQTEASSSETEALSSSEEQTEPSSSETEAAPETTRPPQTEPIPTTEAPTTQEPTENTDMEAAEARIDELVDEVYALREYYTAQLAQLEAAAIAEYEALPPEERTPERKQEIALRTIDRAYALEDACDSRMDAICEELSYLLLETGGSFSLVTDIRYAYASEKEAARTEFLNKYADYFG